MHSDNHPLRVHLEEKQESEDSFASEHDRLVLQQLRDGHLECLILLQGVIEFVIRLNQGDVYHGKEGLLDPLRTIQEGLGELGASDRLEDGWEQSRIQLANVRYRDSG